LVNDFCDDGNLKKTNNNYGKKLKIRSPKLVSFMNGRPQESGGKSRDQKLGVFVDCNELVINEPITGCTLIMIESKNLSMNYKIL
jgi:hypothetical protein